MNGIILNFWTTIFLASAAQGLFLSIVLFSSKKKYMANYFLSALIFLFSINLFFYVLFWSGITANFPLFFTLVLKIVFLFGPLAYLYVKSIKGHKFSPGDLKHFYLFPIVSLLTFIPFESFNQSIGSMMPLFECISLLFYSVLIFREARTSGKRVSKINKFIFQYSILFALFAFSYVSYYLLYYIGILRLEYDYAISLSMSAIVYFIGYRGYFLPELHGNPLTSVDKYEKSRLNSRVEKYYADKILSLMKDKKLYTDSDLRLHDLAKQLRISSHHTSQVINSFFKQSFSDFVNKFRIEAAMKMMNSTEYSHETLIGIAYSCGFNNKVSFNNAFQKFVGVSPGSYRRTNNDTADSKYHPAEA